MVENFDFQELSCSNQISGHLDVRFAWAAVFRWVIVYQNAGAPGGYND
jgi:hypothetical protein